MKQGSQNRKVNQQAREVIANILLFEISDPRLSLVTITGCEVSYDRSACNVFYTADKQEYEAVASAFAKASGRIRSLMARQLSWRVAPQLRFILDSSVDQAERIANALERDAWRNNASAQGACGADDDREHELAGSPASSDDAGTADARLDA